jgi:serine/threonine-protein kinase
VSGGRDREWFRRIAELFEAVTALPPDQRDDFIASACGEDDEIRTELTSLLASHGAAPEFLDRMGGEILPAAFGTDPDDPLAAGSLVGRYRIIEPLGRGGMGIVYKARDESLNRSVALKFLPAHLASDARARARLENEARAASALDHPNIAVVYDIATWPPGAGGRLFIAMACYDGETIDEKIARGPLPVSEALSYFVQLIDGLSRAHEAGIVHRDVKPANLVVASGGHLRIVDFGVARDSRSRLTREGARLGTVAYMSPEQTRGDEVDERTDIWSAGVMPSATTIRQPSKRCDRTSRRGSPASCTDAWPGHVTAATAVLQQCCRSFGTSRRNRRAASRRQLNRPSSCCRSSTSVRTRATNTSVTG